MNTSNMSILNITRESLIATFRNPEGTAGTFVRVASDAALSEITKTVTADENLTADIRKTIILAIEDYIYEQENNK